MRLIDADALNIYDISPVDGFSVMGVTEEDIMLAPTVQPAIEPRPRGRWLYLSDSDGEHYYCSQCGEELPRYSLNTPTWDDPYTYLRSIDKSNFCPNCGADMREEAQDD